MATTARSGVARSGDTTSGDATLDPLVIRIGGATVTTAVEDLSIRLTLEGPATARGRYLSASLAPGAAVEVWRGGVSVGVPLFAGTAVQLEPRARRFAERVTTEFVAVDYRWLMDQATRITRRFQNVGVNMAVRAVLPAGFSAGYLPASLGNIGEMQITDETVSRCLDRIAAQVEGGAYWGVSATKVVSMWPASEDPPHLYTAPLAVTDATAHRNPRADLDITNIRTRVTVEGGGAATTSLTSAGATVVPVDETGWYNASSGGGARAAQAVFTYAACSPASGPGLLVGCAGITDDLPQGETVYVRETADDASAQAALFALIGTSLAVHTVKDGRINAQSAASRAAAELTFYDDVIRGLAYEVAEDVGVVPGRTVAVSLTRPAVIQQTARIQTVSIEKFGAVTATSTVLVRKVDTRPTQITLTQILRGEG
jgi:hypothetical protein